MGNMFNNAFAAFAMIFSGVYRFAKAFDNIGKVAESASGKYAATYEAEHEQELYRLSAETERIKSESVKAIKAS